MNRHQSHSGTIDLVMRGTTGLEIIDFKTRTRPEEHENTLQFYKHQLYLYAEALEKRKQQPPSRLLLYWLAEERKEHALMEIPYRREDMQQTSLHFDEVVEKIKQRKFHVLQPPNTPICNACTLRHLCMKQKIIPSRIGTN